jgi:uncharacterized protein YbaR (Trm112 family)
MPGAPDFSRQHVEFDPKVLEQLACPVCFGGLEFDPARDQIRCSACLRIYPLVDGIPILIPERAG